MATSDNENYWRIYLLHHEGSSLISKQVLSREVEKCGDDLDNLLLKNKEQLVKIVSTLDTDILFPKSKKTDTEQWKTDLLLRVILILFSKTLPKSDRQHIRGIQNVQNHISSLQEPSLDPEAYDDLTESLSEALRELGRVLSRETETKINELVNVFIDEPFNVANMLNKNTIFNLPEEIQQKLTAVFLQAHLSVSEEKKCVDEILYDWTRDAQPKAPTDTQLDSGNKQDRKLGDSDDIYRSSDDGTISAYLSDLIVQNVGVCLTEQEARDWKEAEIEESIKSKSFDKAAKDKLEKWEDEVVKVAVLGRTGTGKSHFINAIRGCTSKTDPLYAKVGSIETTTTVGCYTHPNNSKLKLYDIPGMDTLSFTRETYMTDKQINFYSYDIYLLMSSDRFTQDDKEIATALEKKGKLFLFVRTRVDINIEDVDDKEAEIAMIRADCLAKMRVKPKDLYLISSKNIYHPLLDWGNLLERLVDSLSGLKKDALMFSLQHQANKFIEEKMKTLWKRTMKAGIKYAVREAVHVPGLSFEVDVSLISNELDFYRQTLGITDNDLTDLAKKTNKDVNKLKREHKLKTFDLCKATRSGVQIGRILTRIATSEAAEQSSQLLSFIGFAVGAAASAVTATYFLRSSLKLMVEDAKTMMDIRVEKTDEVLSSEQI